MPLHYEKKDGIAVFTIENGSVNPTTPSMHKALYLALRDFTTDPAVRCGIMHGAGEKAFCAGDDIRVPYRKDASPKDELASHLWPHHDEGETPETFAWSRDVLTMDRYKPIVGAISGWCLGQGLIYLLSLTDIRIATPSAKFGFPEIAYGMGGAGGSSRLALHVPHTTAMWMLMTGEPLDAEEARANHLVNRIVPQDKLMEEAHRVAGLVMRHPPAAVRVEMEAYEKGRDLSKADALAFTKHLYRLQRLGLKEDGPLPDTFLYGRKPHDTAP